MLTNKEDYTMTIHNTEHPYGKKIKINKTQKRILDYIEEKVKQNRLVNLSMRGISNTLDIEYSLVSRSIIKLKEKGIFKEDEDGNLFIVSV